MDSEHPNSAKCEGCLWIREWLVKYEECPSKRLCKRIAVKTVAYCSISGFQQNNASALLLTGRQSNSISTNKE